MNKKGLIWTIVAIIVIIIIVIAVANSNKSTSNVPASTDQASTSDASVPTTTDIATSSNARTVTYTNSGFSPASITIKKGDTVTFVNQSSNNMWVASDPHPAHSGYSGTTRTQHCPDTAGTAFDQCASGNQYTFTFQKTGTWGYHNHAVDEDRGTIIVQ